MASIPDTRISPAEYLRRESDVEEKSEFIDGFTYAMAGASWEHARITSALNIRIGMQLLGRPCSSASSDVRVRTPSENLYTYPDVVIVCGEPILDRAQLDTLLNPTVIIEVLSPSTEKWDRGGKFARYQSIPSLQDYILVSQSEPRIERFSREEDGWKLVTAEGLNSSIALPSIDVQLSLGDVYDGIEFDPLAPPKS